jgi:multisubunit Na+/H+ antiporter MnhC subunit
LERKKAGVWGNIEHALIHAVCIVVFLGLHPRSQASILGLAVVSVAITHFLIDWIYKRRAETWSGKLAQLAADQLLHIIVIVVFVVVVARTGLSLCETAWHRLMSVDLYLTILVHVTGTVLAVWTGGVVIGIRMKPFQEGLQPQRDANVISPPLRGFEGAGKLIGQLERFLIFLFVITNQYTALGFLITAKTILRFGEIKTGDTATAESRKEPEYVLIGTLMSVAWAVAIGLLAQMLSARILEPSLQATATATTPSTATIRPETARPSAFTSLPATAPSTTSRPVSSPTTATRDSVPASQ